jgi:hypothetical protein
MGRLRVAQKWFSASRSTLILEALRHHQYHRYTTDRHFLQSQLACRLYDPIQVYLERDLDILALKAWVPERYVRIWAKGDKYSNLPLYPH